MQCIMRAYDMHMRVLQDVPGQHNAVQNACISYAFARRHTVDARGSTGMRVHHENRHYILHCIACSCSEYCVHQDVLGMHNASIPYADARA